MRKRYSYVFPGSDKDRAEIKDVGVWVVAVDFEDFGDKSQARPSFDVHNDVQRIRHVRFNRTKAKVNPDTTMATSDRPRAMVVVKACCRTLVAFSQGEFAWAKTGSARASATSARLNKRSERWRKGMDLLRISCETSSIGCIASSKAREVHVPDSFGHCGRNALVHRHA